MNRITKLTAAMAIAGGVLLAATHAPAFGQPVPPAPPGAEGPGGDWRPWRGSERGGPGGPGMGMPGGGPRLFNFREDKALTPDEVRRIAEGALLWLGERDWRVVDVAEGPDNTVTYGVAARDGGAFMRFAMDRRTGRVRRIG